MMQRDDFEHRLGQGLKRWAQAGEPTMDLEDLVKQRAAASSVPSETSSAALAVKPVPTESAPALPGSRRRWVRWLSGMAAAAALVAAVGITFPTWAGAAAGWPLVGPVVKEIIMKDAGLKWAYDQGFIQGTVAEVTEDGVTVRILGFVADRVRTTLIYQITGWKDPDENQEKNAQPIEGSKWLSMARPVSRPPSIVITRVNSLVEASWMSAPVRTPVGMLGTASTGAINGDQANVEVMVNIGEKKIPLSFTIKRTADASHEVTVDQAQEIGGINIKVNAVVYTPAETMVRYSVETEPFFGDLNLNQIGGLPYLEVNGKRVTTTSAVGYGGQTYIIFPGVVKGEARFVVPGEPGTRSVDLRFPLKRGAIGSVLGTEVTLKDYLLGSGLAELELEWPADTGLMGLTAVELIDGSGARAKLDSNAEGSWNTDGKEGRRISGKIPEGFQPVAVRLGQAAVAVKGPWIFALPR